MNRDLTSFLAQLNHHHKLALPEILLQKSQNQKHCQFDLDSIYHLIDTIIERAPSNIGLKSSELIQPNSFYGLGYLFMSARNLLDACQKIAQFPNFYHRLATLSVCVDGRHVHVRVSNRATQALTNAVINEAMLSILYRYTDWLGIENMQHTRFEFTHQKLCHPSDYQTHLHQIPEFCARRNSMIVPLSAATREFHSYEPQYHEALLYRLKAEHQMLNDTLPMRVQRIIREELAVSSVTRAEVARQLGMSEKTLERRLSESDLSFSAVLQRTRETLADMYLKTPGMSIDEIARKLGYSDRSAFTKAYKRWTGNTPSVTHISTSVDTGHFGLASVF
ncbi:AraC family transcriptional regulator [Reinekea sp. G2M2-21]|uniref:AraC family transcriptional regulator n=1 Tax=Reinekea sp. G2M2-21 TaxID=2788942 RepID=UPI0018AA602A|nr:AraC family transcriptional regulator [Reinekea sp. G2M2-21]